ncbi:type ISP restriction/modification enzyme [Streptomyces sp. LHD-70]|uniref:type ISP restriction/modification enzyme n=1 Tax=Streptomyces sp. LHD-70 TaxID=3072140 RepID=UPI00280FAD19|nr:type ISP restriction/modification enzyme [Streptomyces sp. LHD-70]MDQ8702994.1 type ISP restriction/modification enzyme [Streptomyces sp. LHD-70]
MTHSDVAAVSAAPLLDDLLPWSVAPLRLGRGWPMAPDAASLKARWAAFVRAEAEQRQVLLHPSRSRTLITSVAQLPGQSSGTRPLADESGPCPEPVRVLHGPFDEQWLLPDHRLIDAARPELWRVADVEQLFLVEPGHVPEAGGPALVATALLPDGRSPAGRPGRIRPLYRRPGGTEPNLAPGLLDALADRLGTETGPEELLAWCLAAARRTPSGCRVPLTADPDVWAHGVDLGHRILWLHLRTGERPKLPGGRRPYVRSALPARPTELLYDREEEALHIGEGRISPVPAAAWDFHVCGVRVLQLWFERRSWAEQPEGLEALRPSAWPQAWTSELLELITVLSLLAEVRPRQEELVRAAGEAPLGAGELRTAKVLPVPDSSRRPASVLDHQEEGPGGQFALL